MPNDDQKEGLGGANEVAIDYIKAPTFQTYWIDGLYGGTTPHGHVQMAVYTERHAIPQRQVFSLDLANDTESMLDAEVLSKRISRESVVREMSCNLMLSAETAEGMGHWLLEMASELKNKEKGETN